MEKYTSYTSDAGKGERARFLQTIVDRCAEDQQDRVERWKHATMNEHGNVLAELLDVVDAIGNYPLKRDMFPGFRSLRRRRG